MSTLTKTFLSILSSKKGRGAIKGVLIVFFSPLILCLILVMGGADGGAKHNNHMIETVFRDLPISASVPEEFKVFVENFQYSMNRIDEEIDMIESEVHGNFDRVFIKSILYSLFVDTQSNEQLRNINYTSYIECFIDSETQEIEIKGKEDSEVLKVEITTKRVITNTTRTLSNVSSFLHTEITEEKTEMIYEIYAQVNSNFGKGFDVYASVMSLIAPHLEASKNRPYAGGQFGSPFESGWKKNVTSEFGKRDEIKLDSGATTSTTHTGIDIAKRHGTPIQVVNDGVVIAVRNTDIGLGLFCIVDHGGGIFTVYGHTSRILVKEGDKVVKGQVIAEVGSTGYSTGAHLHLEVIENSKYVNPRNYLK